MTGPDQQIGVGGLVLGDREKELVFQVLASNRLSYGPLSREFESRMGELHGCREALFCNSGTSALHLALAALKETDGWEDGDEVIVPATTFISTANAVIHSGLRPVLADVLPDTFNIDPESIASRLTERTRAIMPVHLLGLPADMDPILELARARGLRVVEDSCECMFATYKKRPVGSLGDVSCFSTYVAHLVTTGVGGLAMTNDPRLADVMRSLMNHGRDTKYVSIDDDRDLAEDELWSVVQSRYRFNRLGFSYRITELEAALGVGQLDQYEHFVARRHEIAAHYRQVLAPFADRVRAQASPPDRSHAYMVFGCVCVTESDARDLTRFLENRGIETRPLFPLVNQSIYAGAQAEGNPVADMLSRHGFYIGCHPYLTDAQVDYVGDSLVEFFGS